MITEIKQVNGETFAKVRLTPAIIREYGWTLCCALCADSALSQDDEIGGGVSCAELPPCQDNSYWVRVEEGVL